MGHINGMMVKSIQVNLLKVAKKASEKWNTLMVLHMKVSSYKIRYTVMGHMNGIMVKSIQVNLLMVSEKAKEKRNTLMVNHMKDNSFKIRSMDKGY
jgi:hypothetical protein